MSMLCAIAMSLTLVLPVGAAADFEKNEHSYSFYTAEDRLSHLTYLAPDNQPPATFSTSDYFNSSIEVNIAATDDLACTVSGQLTLMGNVFNFSAGGYVFYDTIDGDELSLTSVSGQMGDAPVTLVIAYSYTNGNKHIYMSIGALGQDEFPMQIEFGELTDNLASIHQKFFETSTLLNASNNDANYSIMPRLATDETAAVGTAYGKTPQGKNATALTLFMATTGIGRTNIDVCSKVTTNSSNLLSYLQTVNTTARTLTFDKVAIKTVSHNSIFNAIDVAPKASSTTVTYFVPWIDILEQTVNFKQFTHNIKSVTVSESPASKPTTIEHVLDFGQTLWLGSKTNWSGTPASTQAGVSTQNIYTYLASSGSAKIVASATPTIGYFVDGSRPDQNIYKTYVMSTIQASATITLRSAS